MGAELNAGTDKESTAVYARMLDQHLPAAFDVMADMVWRPAFQDVDPEREVVLEEIAMYEDDPQDTVFDVLGEAVFGAHPLGRPIIGRAPVIRDTPIDVIADFHARRYVPALGGDRRGRLGRPRRDRRARASARSASAPALEPAPRARARSGLAGAPTCASCARTPSRSTSRSAASGCSAATTAASPPACWTRSSAACPRRRLFQAVREERGLAYSVYSFAGQYADTGQVGLYVGTRPDNLVEAMKVVSDELERLREQPATEAELVRARENVKARVVLGMESTGARMHRLGGSLLFDLPLLETDEVMERIDAVTMDDMRSLVDELWAPGRAVRGGHRARRGRVLRRGREGRGRRAAGRVVIRVAVAGAAGRMGATTCAAVEGAEDMELTGRADPSLGTSVADVLARRRRARGLHDPDQAVGNARAGRARRACTSSSAPPAGTTTSCARRSPARPARSSPRANFAIGAVLMMRFAAEASKHMQSAEIIEYHHAGEARQAVGHRRPHRRR